LLAHCSPHLPHWIEATSTSRERKLFKRSESSIDIQGSSSVDKPILQPSSEMPCFRCSLLSIHCLLLFASQPTGIFVVAWAYSSSSSSFVTQHSHIIQKKRAALQQTKIIGTYPISLQKMTARVEEMPSPKQSLPQRKDNEEVGVVEKEQQVPTNMAEALQIFFLSPGPLLVSISLVTMLTWRLRLLGPLSSGDFLACFGCVIFWLFQEHFLHAQVQHSELDWYGKQIHQEHHDKPYFSISIDPAPLMLAWLATAGLILRCLFPLPMAVSAALGYATAGLFYEWSHYIVHTKVKPPNRFMRTMRDNHMRHHQIDNRYWFAFSLPAIDDVFSTNPDVRAVMLRKRADKRANKTELK
jgi:sterol desaturase/sphingolipid hydroxylase (fatty acid hydroxylase superfamily)